ncbi:unnamed protein product [Sphagnum jensenii]|uniref:MICOS complex subunit MIC10 n=1 Tax=Sphagnum jensenii TaxID=128206 RepID=A0ABP1ARY4_9BRYO
MAHAKERPAQLQLDQQWDACIDLTMRRFVYGSLAGGASALLLFRSPTARWAAFAFGAGVGLGSAYADGAYIFGRRGSKESDWEITQMGRVGGLECYINGFFRSSGI